MKRVINIVELPPVESNRSMVKAEVKLRLPGLIRQTSVMAKPSSISVLMRATGREPPPMELIPVIIYEADPDAQEETRNFLIVPPGAVIETVFGVSAVYCGSFLFPQGAIMFLFEEVGSPSTGITFDHVMGTISKIG